MLKVGMRVRVIAVREDSDPGAERLLGRETVITEYFDWDDGACWGTALSNESGNWWWHTDELAPLTDPLAEQFLERIRKLEREPMPMQKETV